MADLTKKEVEILAEKKLLGTITPEEDASLQKWLSAQSEKEVSWNRNDKNEAALKEKLFQRILLTIKSSEQKTIFALNNVWRVAAILVLVLSAAFFIRYSTEKKKSHQASVVTDVQPGKSGAVLTLSNGQTVSLDSTTNRIIATQNNYRVILRNGSLQYEQKSDNANNNNIPTFNTVSTPKGRQFTFVLSDGTHVWLNAGSSIQYPVAFSATREVLVTGEAYFEVAKNPQHPFIVTTERADVTVLGTHFAITAYKDEDKFTTTLLEGSVSIAGLHNKTVMNPGQQASINKSGFIQVQSVDTTESVAWVHGMLSLDVQDVPTLMRQIARWYDVDIHYNGTLPNISIIGMINRNVYLSELLQALSAYGIKAKLEGRTVLVN